MIELLLVDGVILEDDNVLEATFRLLAILRVDVQRVRATLLHRYAELDRVRAHVRRHIARTRLVVMVMIMMIEIMCSGKGKILLSNRMAWKHCEGLHTLCDLGGAAHFANFFWYFTRFI